MYAYMNCLNRSLVDIGVRAKKKTESGARGIEPNVGKPESASESVVLPK